MKDVFNCESLFLEHKSYEIHQQFAVFFHCGSCVFRWPTFHYCDQTTRQDHWGHEKKKSVGLPKPAFFQSKFKDDQLQNICSAIESCLPWIHPWAPNGIKQTRCCCSLCALHPLLLIWYHITISKKMSAHLSFFSEIEDLSRLMIYVLAGISVQCELKLCLA